MALNSTATAHYFHYRLLKPDSTDITAQGIKLIAHGPLPTPQLQPEPQPETEPAMTAPTLPSGDDRKVPVQGMESHKSYQAVLWKPLDKLESLELDAEPKPQEPPREVQSVQQIVALSCTLALLTAQVEELQHQVQQLQAERNTLADRLEAAEQRVNQVSPLQSEIECLTAENTDMKAKLEAFRTLLTNGNSNPIPSPVTPAPTSITPDVAPPLH